MPSDTDGALLSEALAVRLTLEDGRLRLYDRRTGLPLLSPSERMAAAEARIADAEMRTAAAEACIAELERLLRERDQN